jgi:uncharacterized membrane protein
MFFTNIIKNFLINQKMINYFGIKINKNEELEN